MANEITPNPELDQRVMELFAEIQEAGLRALEAEDAADDRGEFATEALAEDTGEAFDEDYTTGSFRTATESVDSGAGVCRILVDGVPVGCYPGLTRRACERIARNIPRARAQWASGGSC